MTDFKPPWWWPISERWFRIRCGLARRLVCSWRGHNPDGYGRVIGAPHVHVFCGRCGAVWTIPASECPHYDDEVRP